MLSVSVFVSEQKILGS